MKALVTMSELELRFRASKIECRNRESRTIAGYGAVFGKPSDDLGGFYEVIDSRAFNRSEGRGFPGMQSYFNHDHNIVLGTVAGGTMRVSVDQRGLHYEVDLPETRADILELVTRGDITSSSFTFRAVQDDWEYEEDSGRVKRTLLEAQLFETGPVTTPAYPDATVGLRSLARAKDAAPADIKRLAEEGELRKLFKRTDTTPAAPVGPSYVALYRGMMADKA